MWVRHKHDIAVIIIVVIGIVGYASLRSELRLRRDMPAQFFDSSRFTQQKRVLEEKVAKAYWNCAVNQIQWQYGYGHRLPEEPPLEFSVSIDEIGPAVRDEAMRRVEWQRLRQVWNVSEVWNIHYELSFVSLRSSLHSAGNWWDDMFHSLSRAIVELWVRFHVWSYRS